MERLSGMDALFLYLETPTQHMHVTLCVVLDPSGMPGGYSFARIKDHIAGRTHLIPPFTRRLVPVPMNLHHPLWVDDPDFDIDRHIHRAALPAPGGPHQLATFTAQIAGVPLDRSRPLWEMWIVEGVDVDHFCLIAKLHHCMLDGVAGVEQLVKLFDFDRNGDGHEIGPPGQHQAEAIPTDLELVAFAAVSRALGTLDVIPLIGRTASSLLAVRQARRAGDPDNYPDSENYPAADISTGGDADSDSDADADISKGPARTAGATETRIIDPPAAGGTPLDAPPTAFNGTITARRRVAFARISLDLVKTIKASVTGATVNDVILTVCAGAIRQYLRERGDLPATPLVAACPVNVRTADQQGRADNRVSALFALLHTDIADPAARLSATVRTASAAKREHAIFPADTLQQWAEILDPNLAKWLSGAYANSGVAQRHRPAINVMISNVPGPPVSLYLAGAELTRAYPMGQIIEGVGLNITAMSYRDSIDFGFMAASTLVPDVDQLAAAVAPALASLAASLTPPPA